MSVGSTPPAGPPPTPPAQPAAPTPPSPATNPATTARKMTQHKTSSIPVKSRRCMVCNHKDETDILKDKLAGMSHIDLAKKYFPNTGEKTARNSLTKHYKKHININQASALLPAVIATTKGTCLSLSTQRVFNQAMRDGVNAQRDIEQMLSVLKDRINVLEDEYAAMHLVGKCDHCGRADNPFNDVNTKKFIGLVKSFNDLTTNWLKIKNPRTVIKYFFDTTFLKFVQSMMSFYLTNLQEKGRLIRNAVNEYSEGKISHQLLLRRVAEVEDMGSVAMVDRGKIELRAIQEYIDKEFSKQGWGVA